MGKCIECGQTFDGKAYIKCDWSGTNFGTGMREVTEENATTVQCWNPECDIYNKLQNWCVVCQSWYLAEQPRAKGALQCPHCRKLSRQEVE